MIGAVLGIVAGYFGGRTDLVVTYLITVRLSLPVILVALTTVALVGSSLWSVILVLGHPPSKPRLVGGYTPLTIAKERGRDEIVGILLRAGSRE